MADQTSIESIGKYRLLSPLGTRPGRGGTVYRATEGTSSATIAVRVITPDASAGPWFADRCVRTLQPYAALQHPALLSPLELGQEEGRVYIAMPLATGTLRERLGSPRTIAEANGLLLPIAEALDHLHARRLVHGDLRPANILLAADGQPLLADAGLAPALREANGFSLGDGAARVPGDPVYRAPEQFQFTLFDLRADLYAFGVIAYELLTGRPPFTATDPAALATAHGQTPPPPPSTIESSLPSALDAVFAQALAKFPFERYASATALCDAIEAATLPVTTSPSSGATTPTPPARDSALAAPVEPATASPRRSDDPPRLQSDARQATPPVPPTKVTLPPPPRPWAEPEGYRAAGTAPKWVREFEYGPIEMLWASRHRQGALSGATILGPLLLIWLCSGNAGLTLFGLILGALGLAAFIFLWPATVVRCDLAGFSVERRNRLTTLSATSDHWANVTALRYGDWQSTSRDGKKRLIATFTVEVNHADRFKFPGEINGFDDLIELCSARCAHLPYVWVYTPEAQRRAANAPQIGYSKVPRDPR